MSINTCDTDGEMEERSSENLESSESMKEDDNKIENCDFEDDVNQTDKESAATLEEIFKKRAEEEKLLKDTFLKPYLCVICNKRFTYPSQLRIHEKLHFRKALHICVVCKLKLPSAIEHFNHMRSHSVESCYQCRDCGKSFSDRIQRDAHSRRHIGPILTCELCEKTFRHMGSLTVHLRTHAGERSYRCETCDKCFTKKSDLNRHIRVHTGYRPHVCNVCQKNFSRNDHLLKHMRTHSGQVYICEFCSKKYLKLETFTAHLKQHANDRFECADCNMRFPDKSHLDKHKCQPLQGHILD